MRHYGLDQINSAKQRGAPEGLVCAIPYLGFLGVVIEEEADGTLLCCLPFQEKLIGNPTLPAIHGGVIGGLLESVALLQLIWSSENPTLPRTINTSIDYLRSAQTQDTFARGHITKQGRRVANVRAEAWQAVYGRPIATVHGHFLLG